MRPIEHHSIVAVVALVALKYNVKPFAVTPPTEMPYLSGSLAWIVTKTFGMDLYAFGNVISFFTVSIRFFYSHRLRTSLNDRYIIAIIIII